MSQPFLGEIRMFGGNFASRSHAFCDGQLVPISQNSALFANLGTFYGGDGRNTFGLPDLRGRIPNHQGTGPGLTNRSIGSRPGEENVILAANPQDNVLAEALTTTPYLGQNPNVNLNTNAVTAHNGGGQRHNNVQPFLCINFIIALDGLFPSRN